MPTDSAPTYVNRRGRKPGRGLRPWLLVPKVLAVSVYFGAMVTATVLWLFARQDLLTDDPTLAVTELSRIRWIFVLVAIPGLLLAMLTGVGLLLQHPRVFLQQRWLRVKLVSLFLGIPVLHFLMSSRLGRIRHAAEDGIADTTTATQFTIGMAVVLVWSIWIITLGKLKPRLGQKHRGAATADTQPVAPGG